MQLEVDNIEVRYGRTTAVKNLNMRLEKGEIACLLGPSGCGKTTLQRAIAGFEPIHCGKIILAGKTVSTPAKCWPAEKRQVGMVFQDFALFPHLTVAENVGFGLHHLSRNQRADEVSQLLALIELEKFRGQYPHELSGGQQQRVALARAIAPQPDILLLDEAFSSLDAALRENLARGVRDLLKKRNITAILATHNQFEAFAIADTLGVMNNGELLQWDTPYNIYHRPESRFVSQFIGEGRLIDGHVNTAGTLLCALGEVGEPNGWETNTRYSVLVRPDDIVFDETSDLRLEILEKRFRGAEYLYKLRLPEEQWVQCETPSHVDFPVGSELPVATDLKHLVVFPHD